MQISGVNPGCSGIVQEKPCSKKMNVSGRGQPVCGTLFGRNGVSSANSAAGERLMLAQILLFYVSFSNLLHVSIVNGIPSLSVFHTCDFVNALLMHVV